MTAPHWLGPLYHPWWQRRLLVIGAISLVTPAFVLVAGASSGDPRITLGAMITGAVLIYVIQVALCLAMALTMMPREIKREWEHRRLRHELRQQK